MSRTYPRKFRQIRQGVLELWPKQATKFVPLGLKPLTATYFMQHHVKNIPTKIQANPSRRSRVMAKTSSKVRATRTETTDGNVFYAAPCQEHTHENSGKSVKAFSSYGQNK